MPLLKDQAIVLRQLDYSETSQVLATLTRAHGPRRLMAKGVKRSTQKGKPSSSIDLLEHGELVFLHRPQQAEGLALLTEWRQLNAYLGLRNNLAAWYAGQYVAEVTAAMTEEGDPHPELFDALVALLTVLAEERTTLEEQTPLESSPPISQPPTSPSIVSSSLVSSSIALPALIAYQRALLVETGWWPDLNRCMLCDRSAPSGRAGYYAAVQGGLVCRQCEPRVAVKRYMTAVALDAWRSQQFNDVDAASAELIFAAMDETIGTAIGRQTRMGSHIVKS